MPLLVALVALCSVFATRVAAADVDVHINVFPPAPVITFEAEPEIVVVPQTHVYYAPHVAEYDMYRYGKYWYVNRDGYWYRSHGYRGPFKPVQYRQLPRQIVVVPASYRHHPTHPHANHHPGKKKHKHKDHR